MKLLRVSSLTPAFIFLVISCATFAQTIPAEMTGIWGPPKSQWGRGDDGKNTRCEADPAKGNNPSLFYGFFPDGNLAAGNPMGYQCLVSKIDKTTSGYSGLMRCTVEGSIKETKAFIYIKDSPPQLIFGSERLYKCKMTL
jgi:hypothetical protein